MPKIDGFCQKKPKKWSKISKIRPKVLDFWTIDNIFGFAFNSRKRPEFLDFFLQKAVEFCKIQPDFETVTGMHGLT